MVEFTTSIPGQLPPTQTRTLGSVDEALSILSGSIKPKEKQKRSKMKKLPPQMQQFIAHLIKTRFAHAYKPLPETYKENGFTFHIHKFTEEWGEERLMAAVQRAIHDELGIPDYPLSMRNMQFIRDHLVGRSTRSRRQPYKELKALTKKQREDEALVIAAEQKRRELAEIDAKLKERGL